MELISATSRLIRGLDESANRETHIREKNNFFSYLLQQYKIKYCYKQKFL